MIRRPPGLRIYLAMARHLAIPSYAHSCSWNPPQDFEIRRNTATSYAATHNPRRGCVARPAFFRSVSRSPTVDTGIPSRVAMVLEVAPLGRCQSSDATRSSDFWGRVTFEPENVTTRSHSGVRSMAAELYPRRRVWGAEDTQCVLFSTWMCPTLYTVSRALRASLGTHCPWGGETSCGPFVTVYFPR